jgi:hypothetical protein
MTWQRERRTGRTVWIEEVMMGLSYTVIKYQQQVCCVTVYSSTRFLFWYLHAFERGKPREGNYNTPGKLKPESFDLPGYQVPVP